MFEAYSSFDFQCIWCREAYDESSKIRTCSKCNGALDIRYDYKAISSRLKGIPVNRGVVGVWRYTPLLPISQKTSIISLGEGQSPLRKMERISGELGMKDLFIKDESRNPTLSFKDRKMTVAVTKAVENGSNIVSSATAGNAGSSVAAYAAKAGIESYIFAFEGISRSKLAKLLSYGAKVFLTSGSTGKVDSFVQEVSKKFGFLNLSAASRYDPFTKEGAKTALFEIFEQFDQKLPRWIVIPVGGGGNLTGYFKGLRDLKELGLVEEFPKLVGVQGKGCAPVVEAFEKRLDPRDLPTIKNPKTIAHSILDDWAPDGDQALISIRESKGLAIGVTDEEIIDAMKMLSSREGIFLEPSSSATLAAVKQLLENQTIDKDESIVIVGTGSGLNQPDSAIDAWRTPPTIETDVEAFGKYLRLE